MSQISWTTSVANDCLERASDGRTLYITVGRRKCSMVEKLEERYFRPL